LKNRYNGHERKNVNDGIDDAMEGETEEEERYVFPC
jgi:hypothetical protein